jgi:hypothetical protein
VDNIKMNLTKTRWDGMEWIDLAKNMDQWRAVVNTVMTFGFHKMLGNSLVAAQLAASQDGLSCMELVIY